MSINFQNISCNAFLSGLSVSHGWSRLLFEEQVRAHEELQRGDRGGGREEAHHPHHHEAAGGRGQDY